MPRRAIWLPKRYSFLRTSRRLERPNCWSFGQNWISAWPLWTAGKLSRAKPFSNGSVKNRLRENPPVHEFSRLRVSQHAAQDLDDIWEHVARDSVDAADRLIARLREQIQLIARSPGIGHRRVDLAEGRNILFWPVGNYVILYRVRQESVEIIAIVHGKRDIPAFIRRRGI